MNGRVWNLKNGTWQAVGGIAAMGMNGVPLPAFAKRWLDVATPADGSIYAIGPDTGAVGAQDSTLYRYNPTSNHDSTNHDSSTSTSTSTNHDSSTSTSSNYNSHEINIITYP